MALNRHATLIGEANPTNARQAERNPNRQLRPVQPTHFEHRGLPAHGLGRNSMRLTRVATRTMSHAGHVHVHEPPGPWAVRYHS